jgi:hypothetical protein
MIHRIIQGKLMIRLDCPVKPAMTGTRELHYFARMVYLASEKNNATFKLRFIPKGLGIIAGGFNHRTACTLANKS